MRTVNENEGTLLARGELNRSLERTPPRGSIESISVHAKGVMVRAKTDREAVQLFLNEYETSENTYRAYKKECTRLLIWLENYGFRQLSELTLNDMKDFRAFLENPPPEMVGSDRVPCGSPEWRPFRNALKGSSLHQSMRIINSLLDWLVAAGYTYGNPMGLIRQKRVRSARNGKGPAEMRASRHRLTPEAVTAVYEWLRHQPVETATQQERACRNEAIFEFFIGTAARRSELSTARSEHIYCEDGRWWIHVIAKGGDWAPLPLPDSVMNALKKYRQHRGLPPLPVRGEQTPVISKLGEHGKEITDNMVYRLVKSILRSASRTANESVARQLDAASTHWLRHTSINVVAEATKDFRVVQQFGRHASADTTMGYLHDESSRFHDVVAPHIDAASKKSRGKED